MKSPNIEPDESRPLGQCWLLNASSSKRHPSARPPATGTGWVSATSRSNRSEGASQLLRTPHCPCPGPQTSFTDRCHVQKDSHLLVQIQYLTFSKHAFHTNWSHFHR